MVDVVSGAACTISRKSAGGLLPIPVMESHDARRDAGSSPGIMGPSGSGNSTLLHCSAGRDHLSAGSAWIGGVELGTLRDRDLTFRLTS
jgi:putative ABC transport system ATP-binding protein